VLAIEVTQRAAGQVERAAVWWAENRTAAPDAIRVDFEEAKLLLARQPGVGAKSSSANYPDLRRSPAIIRVVEPSGREAFRQDAIRAWGEYQATGLHLTSEEADAWLSKLEGGQDADSPECHA
jgi:hypothetical protein